MIYIPKRIETRNEREDFPLLQSDINLIYKNSVVTSLLDSFPVITLLLNNFRQVLYCNKTYLELTATDPRELVLGLRPGELFGCAYHNEVSGGCGESEHCRYCGAVQAIREAQSKRESSTKEARLTIVLNNQEIAVDFKVTAAPIEVFNSNFTVLTLEDISDSKRRKILERIFFHDIIDKASSLEFALEAAVKSYDSEKGLSFISTSKRLSQELISELLGQRLLFNAENKELVVNPTDISTVDIIERSLEQIKNHQVAFEKDIVLEDFKNFEIITDYLLLNRVLINMMKNALEASHKGEKVTVSCKMNNGNIEFCVANNRVLEENVKSQIFQRSFSTKGSNRGVGTYSMKLLGEQYLNGKVWFESNPEIGTLFFLSIPKILKK